MARNRVARWLVRAWVTLVLIAIAVVLVVSMVPTDLEEHLGSSEILLYGLFLALAIAVLGSPLLIVAAILERRLK